MVPTKLKCFWCNFSWFWCKFSCFFGAILGGRGPDQVHNFQVFGGNIGVFDAKIRVFWYNNSGVFGAKPRAFWWQMHSFSQCLEVALMSFFCKDGAKTGENFHLFLHQVLQKQVKIHLFLHQNGGSGEDKNGKGMRIKKGTNED